MWPSRSAFSSLKGIPAVRGNYLVVTESQTRINLRPSKRTVYTGTVCAQNDKAVGPLIAHFAKSGIPPRTAAPRQPFLVMRVLHPGLARPVDVLSSCPVPIGVNGPYAVTQITASDCGLEETRLVVVVARPLQCHLRAARGRASDQMEHPGENHGIHQTASTRLPFFAAPRKN